MDRHAELTRYELSFRDMLMAQRSLNLAEKADDYEHRSVFLDMAAIAYARPFVKNFVTVGWAVLKIEALFDDPMSDEDLTLHRLVLQLRNSVIAHSDAEMARTYETAIKGVIVFGTAISSITDLQPHLPRFAHLVAAVRRTLADKINAIESELGDDLIPPDRWKG